MATQRELKNLKKRIHDVSSNRSATKEDWLALWEEAERCRKTCDSKMWSGFYWTSGLEMVYMVVSGYEYEEQKQKEREMKS